MGEQKQGISKKIKYFSIIVSALVVISTLIFVFNINKETTFSISNEKAKRMELKIVDKDVKINRQANLLFAWRFALYINI